MLQDSFDSYGIWRTSTKHKSKYQEYMKITHFDMLISFTFMYSIAMQLLRQVFSHSFHQTSFIYYQLLRQYDLSPLCLPNLKRHALTLSWPIVWFTFMHCQLLRHSGFHQCGCSIKRRKISFLLVR